MEIRQISYHDLRKNTGNIREDYGDLTPLVNSIAQRGLITPLIVDEQDDGTYVIKDGNRRLAALDIINETTIVGNVPCIVSIDNDKEIALITGLMSKNLTDREAATGFRQLQMDLGLSVSEIAETTGFDKKYVKSAVKAAGASEKSFESGLTLDQLATVATYEKAGNQEAVEALNSSLGNENKFKQITASIKAKEAWAATEAKFREQWRGEISDKKFIYEEKGWKPTSMQIKNEQDIEQYLELEPETHKAFIGSSWIVILETAPIAVAENVTVEEADTKAKAEQEKYDGLMMLWAEHVEKVKLFIESVKLPQEPMRAMLKASVELFDGIEGNDWYREWWVFLQKEMDTCPVRMINGEVKHTNNEKFREILQVAGYQLDANEIWCYEGK
jgi:ParB/RepB/Spo0J family partition protein